MLRLTRFKAYDVRGQSGGEFTEKIACRIGRAHGQQHLQARRLAVGGGVRVTCKSLEPALARGLAGADASDIGLRGTEEADGPSLEFPGRRFKRRTRNPAPLRRRRERHTPTPGHLAPDRKRRMNQRFSGAEPRRAKKVLRQRVTEREALIHGGI